jgi:quercetin dioxygenase-like cupin family protein
MLIATLYLVSIAGSEVGAREPAPVVVKEVISTMKNDVGQAITVPSGQLQLVVSTYDIVPGGRLPQHKHPFQRYAYVIQGALNVQQVGSSSRVYHAGEFVVESVNRWHFGQAIGEIPVKLLVIDQLPPGRKATVLRSQTHRLRPSPPAQF